MASDTGLTAAALGLASAATWGGGDFSGGLATRRTPVLVVTLLSQVAGISFLAAFAVARAEAGLAVADAAWGALAGVLGLIGLVCLYRAMAIGQMGLAAPVTGVLSAGLPVAAGALIQGWPGPRHLIGFGLALTGIGLLSKTPAGRPRPVGLGLAVAAGVGFGGFLVSIAQVRESAVFWPLAAARAASLVVLGFLILVRREPVRPSRGALGLIGLAGTMDASGNALFVLAEQAGRLDVAGTLASLYPAITVLLALVVLRERFTRTQTLGLFVALTAVPLLGG